MSIEARDLESDLADLESAEDFLEYFGVACDRKVLQVNRLHILQRFHDYLGGRRDKNAAPPVFDDYRNALTMACNDFAESDALTEKVFSVLKRAAGIATVPITAIGRARH